VSELDFRSLGWTNIDLLLEVLEVARPKQLRRLLLNSNPITDVSVPARLQEVLSTLPQEVQLGIDEIELDEDQAQDEPEPERQPTARRRSRLQVPGAVARLGLGLRNS
jgi:hypothetical protein